MLIIVRLEGANREGVTLFEFKAGGHGGSIDLGYCDRKFVVPNK